MRVFIAVLFLTFSLQSWTKAEDISVMEIEGTSVEDSLLNFFSEDDIKYKIEDAFFYPASKKFMIIRLIPKDMKQYDNINFHIKSNDNKYIIHSVKGMKWMKTEECLELKKKVVKDVKDLIPYAKISNHTNNYDNNNGTSKAYISDFYVDGGVVRVFCTDWDKNFMESKYNKIYSNSLSVNATSDEMKEWLQNEAYK